MKWSVLIVMFVVIIIITVTTVYCHYWNGNVDRQFGGDRAAIFSRFNYQPQFPFISTFNTVDLERFSKVYNMTDPVVFFSGRPYKYYHTEDSTWLYPWHFPQEVHLDCIQEAVNKCHEPIILVKKEEDKLGGLGVKTPKDIVHPSACFIKWYENCQGKNERKN